jgi:hypothetical protein
MLRVYCASAWRQPLTPPLRPWVGPYPDGGSDRGRLAPVIPHTRTGKKLEVPLKPLFQGAEVADVLDVSAIERLIPLYEHVRTFAGDQQRGDDQPPRPHRVLAGVTAGAAVSSYGV